MVDEPAHRAVVAGEARQKPDSLDGAAVLQQDLGVAEHWGAARVGLPTQDANPPVQAGVRCREQFAKLAVGRALRNQGRAEPRAHPVAGEER